MIPQINVKCVVAKTKFSVSFNNQWGRKINIWKVGYIHKFLSGEERNFHSHDDEKFTIQLLSYCWQSLKRFLMAFVVKSGFVKTNLIEKLFSISLWKSFSFLYIKTYMTFTICEYSLFVMCPRVFRVCVWEISLKR